MRIGLPLWLRVKRDSIGQASTHAHPETAKGEHARWLRRVVHREAGLACVAAVPTATLARHAPTSTTRPPGVLACA